MYLSPEKRYPQVKLRSLEKHETGHINTTYIERMKTIMYADGLGKRIIGQVQDHLMVDFNTEHNLEPPGNLKNWFICSY